MPELPEVETLCRQLSQVLPGKEILGIEILDRLLMTGGGEELIGRKVMSVNRQGKSIRMELVRKGGVPGGSGTKVIRKETQDDRLTAWVHLRMTGRLLWTGSAEPTPPYTRLILTFAAGRLYLIDPRRFATFCLRPTEAAPIDVPDPLEGLPPLLLRHSAGGRRLSIKSFLMDQRFVAGIGNIYACEILYHAGIDPRREAGSLSGRQWHKVQKASALVLPRAVECRGTTVSDWRDLFGMSGRNQHHLEVYSREGKPCRRCAKRIERTKISGRGTWFCPSCQK